MKLHHFAATTTEELEAEINTYKENHPELTETDRLEAHYSGTQSPYQAGVLFEKSDFQNERENYLNRETLLDEEDIDAMTQGWKLTWWEWILFVLVMLGLAVFAVLSAIFRLIEIVIITPLFWLFDKITKRT